jgi:hypothetical protein
MGRDLAAVASDSFTIDDAGSRPQLGETFDN